MDSTLEDVRRLRKWCAERDIPVSSCYERLRLLGLKPHKIGRSSYLTAEQRRMIISGSGEVA